MAAKYLRPEWLAGLLLWVALLCTAWIYWPGLNGPSLLDDGANLRGLQSLQESSSYTEDVVRGNSSGPLGRPVSMLSFALTQLITEGVVRDHKYHNLLIHLTCGCFLVWFSLLTFRMLGYKRPAMGAVVVGWLWLFSPLFVSTVLYPVQRMAQLSCLFMLAGLLVYQKGRLRQIEHGKGWLVIGWVPIFSLLAVFSKENGALLLPLVLVVEIYINRFRAKDERDTRWLRRIHLMGIAPLCLVGALFIYSYYASAGYGIRDFSLGQRLLTESRVLWDYIGQLFLPNIRLMGVFHDDFPISTTLWEPLTTCFALACWAGLLVLSLHALKRDSLKLAAFGLIFYLVSHGVESTFLPLEIYFEHRSYLGAAGLYIALVAFAIKPCQQFWPSSVLAKIVLLMLVCWLPMQTSALATVWSNGKLLDLHSLSGHPNSVRANAQLAVRYAGEGDFQRAIDYSRKMHQLDGKELDFTYHLRDLVLACMANQAVNEEVIRRVEFDRYSIGDGDAMNNLQLLSSTVQDGSCLNFPTEKFAEHMYKSIILASSYLVPEKALGVLAGLENYLGRYNNADDYAQRWIQRAPNNPKPWLMSLYFNLLLDRVDVADSARQKLFEMEALGLLTHEQKDDLQLFSQ